MTVPEATYGERGQETLHGCPRLLPHWRASGAAMGGGFGRLHQDTNSLLMRLVRLQERLSCRFADHVVTVSEHWCQVLIQQCVPAYKCSVAMNVADDLQRSCPGSF
jgi:hypothetical protein